MAIRAVALIYDDQVRPDTTGGYCRRALESLVEVKHFLPAQLDCVPRHGFDLYLNVDDSFEYRLPTDLHPSAWWVIDTHLNLPWDLTKAPDFDFVFAAQRDGAESLQQAGIATASWLPLACDPEVHHKHDVSKSLDFCFVGHLFPGPRSELLQLLQRHFANHFVGQRFFEEMARTYSAARIVFNRSIRNDVNMRVFEAVACGSLLLTNDLTDNGQDDLLQDGVHLATYRSADELLDKMSFYRKREDAREKIAAAGRAVVLAKDTYRHRMEWLLREVERGLARTTVGAIRQAPAPEIVPPAIPPALPVQVAANVPAADAGGPFEWAPLVPATARRLLALGFGSASWSAAFRTQPATEVKALDCDVLLTQEGKEADLDRLLAEALAELSEADKPQHFDAVVCDELLEYLRDPLALLRQLRSLLTAEGTLYAGIPSVRNQGILCSLLEGHWPFAPTGMPDRDPVRFFTRREIEKLWHRARFARPTIQVVPGHGYQEWVLQGRPGAVRAGGLHIGSLRVEEAEEFFASRFLVCASPVTAVPYERTSIVILTHNQLPFTRRCLDSLRRYTDEPYELIVVDNASTDGTVDYLRSLKEVHVLSNDTNLGFPAGANQGIRAATGRQVLLLNNDTVVTTGWLGRLLRALHRDSSLGLAGPCSNFVSGEQQIAVSYDDDLMGLDGFAWDWGKAQDGQRVDTDRLIGFCLLIRREVIDRIGLLDERFGVGCFEDDDYCCRALQAGFRAVIARDAFVHHFGGRTFVGSGVDFGTLMRTNQELFHQKWETEPGQSNPQPTADMADTETAPSFTIRTAPGGGLLLGKNDVLLSLCMIVRDNARTLGACLESIRPFVDEMVVVDTGSKDDTPAIAQRLGARVFHFPWPDSFSIARNESLRRARGRWLFWMDSDDTIDAANGRKLRELIVRDSEPSVLGYVMQVHCPGPGEEDQVEVTVVDHVKLFRNLPELRFEHRIHEQILPAIRRADGTVAFTDVHVVHSGYDHSPEGQKKKLERDLRLLHLELGEQPEHPFTLFNLGMTYTDAARYDEAIPMLRRCLAHSGEGESHLRKAYAYLVCCHERLGQLQQAWETCQEGLRHFPRDAELRFRKGILLHALNRLDDAVTTYLDLLGNHEEAHFKSVVAGVSGHMARHNLALVYKDQGDLPRAEAQWRLVVAEKPHYRPGWQGLGELLTLQRKDAELLAVIDQLLADPRLRVDGHILKGRAAAARGDAAEARRELEQAVAEAPEDREALESLCRHLFECGEPFAAEPLLQALIRCDPKNGAAYHNLGTVYLESGRVEMAVAAYRESIRHRPDTLATQFQLGNALHANGRLEEAIQIWEEMLRQHPGDAAATEALRQAKQAPQAPQPPNPGMPRNGMSATEATYPLKLRGRTIDVLFATRGVVDRAILRDLWDRDAYGVREVTESPATVVDVGAHIGAFTLLASETWPSARVIACEADPENFALLERNLSGRRQVETVAAAIVAEEVSEVDFYAVVDKAGDNSGGSSYVRVEAGSVKTRVAALSVQKLWESKLITICDLLKLDCEGAEIPILQALADAGLLAKVKHLVGEWHALDGQPQTTAGVRRQLTAILQQTHDVVFNPPFRGREGHFTARRLLH